MSPEIYDAKARLRVLVALASYGTANDRYLARVIEEYRSMAFDVDIVVLSNLQKHFSSDIKVLVGLPNRDPWSLPFAHKQLFAERLDQHDLFVYSEDDILITERNLRAFLDASAVLLDDEIAGFFIVEKGADSDTNYPQAHAFFHWDTNSVCSRGKYTLASFTNEHAACYALNQRQLREAIDSGGFCVGPHEWKYDLPCSAATDPYTQCGFVKLIPISHLDDFSVHHLPNKYVGKLGVSGVELRRQIDALTRIAPDGSKPGSLVETETRLRRCMYSKDYYEPCSEPVISLIPKDAHTVLSIGCASGATECRLVERGLRVVGVGLDRVICGRVEAKGVDIVLGDCATARAALGSERFDCLLYLNVLHLFSDPVEALSLFRDVMPPGGVALIQTSNMLYYRDFWKYIRSADHVRDLRDYKATGVHFCSIGRVQDWCRKAGLRIEKTVPTYHDATRAIGRFAPGLVKSLLAADFIVVAGH